MRPELSLRNEQRLALVPKMLQSLEVLQLQAGELLQLVDVELERNELLELESSGEGEQPMPEAPAEHEPIEVERPARRRDEPDAKQALLQNLPEKRADLRGYLRLQLAFLEEPEALVRGIDRLVENLDDRGWLDVDETELRREVGEHFDEALTLLQSLEPRGIGARNAIEAMLLQLSYDDPDYPLIEQLLTNHLEALAKNRIPDVARAVGVAVEDVVGLIDRIRELQPRPVADFVTESAAGIRPDLTVYEVDDELIVAVDDLALPALAVNAEYAELVTAAETDTKLRRYLRDKLRSARDLIAAVEQRKATLVRVGAAVMAYQRDFLRRGRMAIRPLKMADIAEQLDLHPSTVSRAIAGKYVQTDQGVVALRDFFDGARGSAASVGSGRLAVKEHVREVIANEDRRHPLSDDEVVSELAKRNVQVARRTVSKYRKELGIASSWNRRRFTS